MYSRIEPTAGWEKGRGSRGINPARQSPPEKHQPPKSDQPLLEKPANQGSAIHVGSQRTSKNSHPGLAHIAYNSVHCTSTQKQSDNRKAQLQAATSKRLAREAKLNHIATIAATEDELCKQDEDYSEHALPPDLHPQDPIEDDWKSSLG